MCLRFLAAIGINFDVAKQDREQLNEKDWIIMVKNWAVVSTNNPIQHHHHDDKTARQQAGVTSTLLPGIF